MLFINHANYKLINILIYLSKYQIKVVYLIGCLNFISNALLYLPIPTNSTNCKYNNLFTLNALYNIMEVLLSVLLTIIINNNLYCHFKVAYKQDTIYNKIIKDLAILPLAIGKSFAISIIRKYHKDIVLALKLGYPFCLANYLLYN